LCLHRFLLAAGFWGEMLWFHNLGYGSRFWEVVLSQFFSAVAGGVFGIIFIFLLTLALGKDQKILRVIACGIGAIVGANWGYANWSVFLEIFSFCHHNGTRPDPSYKYRILPFQAPILRCALRYFDHSFCYLVDRFDFFQAFQLREGAGKSGESRWRRITADKLWFYLF